MAVNINVPSQVKTYANLAAFPASGALKTIYIAEDTNKTYRWTGSVYVEVSASAAMTWGAIGGTLSNQTDLQSALDAKVPTSRTLTINGTTQDLSADRTFTISIGITIGTTAIASGTVGRVLFEGTGNVVQESANLFWDNTNGRLGIGTSTAPSGSVYIDNSGNDVKQHLVLKNSDAGSGAQVHLDLHNNVAGSSYSSGASLFLCSSTHAAPYASALGFWNYLNGPIALATNSAERMRVAASGNVLINTTTDAGFRLDVNGTARVQGGFTIDSTTAPVFRGVNPLTGTTNATSGGLLLTNQTGVTAMGIAGTYGGAGSRLTLFNNYTDPTTSRIKINLGGVDTACFFADGSLQIGNGETTISSAILSASSTTRGFLPPRMTTAQKNAIASPAAGLMVYDTTLNVISYYNGSMWI